MFLLNSQKGKRDVEFPNNPILLGKYTPITITVAFTISKKIFSVEFVNKKMCNKKIPHKKCVIYFFIKFTNLLKNVIQIAMLSQFFIQKSLKTNENY